jgi:tricorn protease
MLSRSSTDGDVWIGSVERAEAGRLGVGPAVIHNLRLSPDGATGAWASDAAGAVEIWVAPVSGGEAQRLSWWGDVGTTLLGWLRDGRLLAATAQGSWHAWDRWAWTVLVDGAPAQRLLWGHPTLTT